MEFLYLLESIRTPVLDNAMLMITSLGEETAFLVVAMVMFWCVDKNRGYYMLCVGFLSTLVNHILKLTFRVPRPWVADPGFTVVEEARAAAGGFSFPSGHSTTAVGTFGAIGYSSWHPLVKGLCYAVCVLVPLSRMYLGVHTPADVLAGAGLAVMMIVVLSPMVWRPSENGTKNILTLSMGVAICLLLFARFFPFSIEASQQHNLQSGLKNAYTMLGAIPGLMTVCSLEKKYINFETKAIWWAQILKVTLGFALVLAVKEGLRAPLDALFAGHLAARAIRYYLIVVAAGALWPLTFRWFSRLGAKK